LLKIYEMNEIIIKIQPTSNSSIIKFEANKFLVKYTNYEFKNIDEAKNSPLAQQLFYLPFTKTVYISGNFIAIEKFDIVDWPDVQDEVAKQIEKYLNSNQPVVIERVGLAGVVEVRLERRGGELLIELTSYRYDDGRPFSLVEAGTGQLDTNVFRGTYADPTALGGSLALALERVDTRGYGDHEGGNRTGTWLRYQLHRGARGGIAFDFRRMSSKTEVSDYAAAVTRTDLTVRGRVEIVDGLVAEAYTGRSSHDVNDARAEYDFEGGSRAQHGVRVAARRDGLWTLGAFRLHTDDDLPARRLEAAGGFTADRLGVHGSASWADWDGTSVAGYGVGGWLGPLAGVTLFGSWDGGSYASPSGPPLDELPAPATPVPPLPIIPPVPPPGPTALIADRSLLRVGASASLFGMTFAAAGMRADADMHFPLGTELDRGAPTLSGEERFGVEGWASLPMPPRG
jgi:hypothetical protein